MTQPMDTPVREEAERYAALAGSYGCGSAPWAASMRASRSP